MGWIVVGVAIVFLTATRWPYGALLVVIGASAMPVLVIQVSGWNARPEHVAGAMVTTAVAAWLALTRRRLRLNSLDYWVLAYVAINYISSAVGSPEPAATLRWALQNNLAVLPYFLIRVLVQDLETFGKAFRILLGVAVVESTYGLLCSVSNHIFGTTTGMAVGEYLVDVAAPYGSMYEPNLFGAYAAACAVMFLSLYLAAEHHRLGHLIGFLVASIASVLSFSRAALFALVVVICFILWKARSAKNGHRTKVVILGLAGGLASLVAVTAVGGVLQERIANLLTQGLSEETTISRVIVIQQALQEVPAHPWLGSGTASFNLSFDWTPYVPEWASDKTWIANAPLRIIHDTGVLGLTAFLGFLVSLWLKIRRTPDKPNSQFPELFALSAGTLLYGISFQFTDGTILAFVWVQLGFLATAAILMNDCESDGRATRSAS